jgi:hypothetical protein
MLQIDWFIADINQLVSYTVHSTCSIANITSSKVSKVGVLLAMVQSSESEW